MRIILYAAAALAGLCLAGADLRPQPGTERGGAPGRGAKITPEEEAALLKTCRNDLDKFCKYAGPSRKKKKCLKENESELSPECGKALKNLPPGAKGGAGRETSAALAKACKDDLGKLCKGVKSAPDQRKCLSKNEGALSAGCGKALKNLPPDRGGKEKKGDSGRQEAAAALTKDCGEDLKKFCGGISSGLEQGVCLMEHEGELSAGCGSTLKRLPPPEPEGGPAGD